MIETEPVHDVQVFEAPTREFALTLITPIRHPSVTHHVIGVVEFRVRKQTFEIIDFPMWWPVSSRLLVING